MSQNQFDQYNEQQMGGTLDLVMTAASFVLIHWAGCASKDAYNYLKEQFIEWVSEEGLDEEENLKEQTKQKLKENKANISDEEVDQMIDELLENLKNNID